MQPVKLVALVVLAAVALSTAACGGNDDAKVEQARKQGAAQERARLRQQQIIENQRRLQRELDRLKRQRTRSGGGGSSGGGGGGGGAAVSGTDCGAGVRAGANTSCPFAQIVRDAFYANGGAAGSFDAFSPVTGRTYTMTCTGGSPHVCTGGNNASVTFP